MNHHCSLWTSSVVEHWCGVDHQYHQSYLHSSVARSGGSRCDSRRVCSTQVEKTWISDKYFVSCERRTFDHLLSLGFTMHLLVSLEIPRRRKRTWAPGALVRSQACMHAVVTTEFFLRNETFATSRKRAAKVLHARMHGLVPRDIPRRRERSITSRKITCISIMVNFFRLHRRPWWRNGRPRG